jgi:uncharacterized protein YlxP (DUF503 family)
VAELVVSSDELWPNEVADRVTDFLAEHGPCSRALAGE